MALSDSAPAVRKKATLSLSSAVRNCQEALDKVLPHLPASIKPAGGKVEAESMEAIDEIIAKIKDYIPKS
jgi:uncharacterized protein YqgV (UPF0045/DUF77 family)